MLQDRSLSTVQGNMLYESIVPPGKQNITDRGKTGPRFGGIRIFRPLRPASTRPGHGRQAAPIFFPAAGWPRDARGHASLFDKIPHVRWLCKVFCDFRLQVGFTFDQNTLFPPVFLRFLGIFVATRISIFSRIPCFPNVFLVF